MAKTNRKPGTSVSGSRSTSPKTSISTRANRASGPTHQQIADRAKEIWRKKGCPAGQDETTWYEAETQLKQELVAEKA